MNFTMNLDDMFDTRQEKTLDDFRISIEEIENVLKSKEPVVIKYTKNVDDVKTTLNTIEDFHLFLVEKNLTRGEARIVFGTLTEFNNFIDKNSFDENYKKRLLENVTDVVITEDKMTWTENGIPQQFRKSIGEYGFDNSEWDSIKGELLIV
ncbi:MAG: glycyl-tRNA synthetase beta subunit [bacterium]|jgi:glycyl-tRNA synthetase beta subunit